MNNDYNNKRILSYEDIKNSEIEIFGNKFEINFSEEYIKRIKEIDINEIQDEEVFKKLQEMINIILNNNEAYEIIKKSYEEHEEKEFGVNVFIKVMTFIFNEYSKEISNIKGTDFGSKNLYANRNQRRYNNNNYNRNNYNRGRRY